MAIAHDGSPRTRVQFEKREAQSQSEAQPLSSEADCHMKVVQLLTASSVCRDIWGNQCSLRRRPALDSVVRCNSRHTECALSFAVLAILVEDDVTERQRYRTVLQRWWQNEA